MSEETGKPEIPQPDHVPDETAETPPRDPSLNGNGGVHRQPQAQPIDVEKLVEWMKHTDKQITILLMGQVALCGAVIFLLYKSKGDVVKTITP